VRLSRLDEGFIRDVVLVALLLVIERAKAIQCRQKSGYG
jgi:hypothetical protein